MILRKLELIELRFMMLVEIRRYYDDKFGLLG